ncbi:MAG TPA: peptide deformylase, partial [Gemmatimonadetes bacterium]|nr:peptide deformylase [Gemmatimonadota bacterium]
EMEEVVTRPARVTVQGFDADGQAVEVEADGLLARALQHEIDHL